MRFRRLDVMAMVCFALTAFGCDRASNSDPAPVTSVSAPVASRPASAATVPAGWKVYTPPEGDFSVVVPADPTDSSSNVLKMWKLRRYTFKKGEAPIVVELYSDRTGKLASNTVEDLRTSPDILPGTLRDVSLPGMQGIEFRTSGRVGEVIFREFCSPDNSQSISLQVQKEVGAGFSEAEVRVFLESFKLLP